MSELTAIFQPAIDALEKDLANLERQANGLLNSINILREKSGLPPRPANWATGAGDNATPGAVGGSVKLHSDTFTGKTMGGAIREYLLMRKASGGDAPATTREILDALKQGGFVSNAKDEHTIMVMLRTTLRKSTAVFVKLQNGKYGLRVWYPNLKAPKETASAEEDAEPTEAEIAATEAESEDESEAGQTAA